MTESLELVENEMVNSSELEKFKVLDYLSFATAQVKHSRIF